MRRRFYCGVFLISIKRAGIIRLRERALRASSPPSLLRVLHRGTVLGENDTH